MAQIRNPKKAFQFNIYAAGLNPYAAQEVNIPEHEFEDVTHGDVGRRINTAGIMVFGAITITKLRPIEVADNWVWSWIQSIRNFRTGGGLIPDFYKRDLTIVQLSYDNVTVTDRWEVEGAYPRRINGMDLSRTESANSMETVELSIDGCQKTL